MTSIVQQLARLMEVHSRTTHGTWIAESHPDDMDGESVNVGSVSTQDGPITWDDHGGEVFANFADAEFLALAHELIPLIASDIQRITQEAEDREEA